MLGRTNTGGGGGGAGLNFRVIGSTIQPTSAKENDIWVNTSTKIESWIFSASEPESPADGMVWFTVGASSGVEFNALKKSGIMVYPLTAKQNVEGAWADVTAKTYQSGAWQDWWAGELYDAGNEYEGITGGFITMGISHDSSYPTKKEPTVTRGTSMTITQNTNAAGIVVTANKIDLTNFDKLVFKGTMKSAGIGTAVSLKIWSELGTYRNDNCVASVDGLNGGVVMTNAEISLDGIAGSYYIGLYVYAATSTIVMDKLYLE